MATKVRPRPRSAAAKQMTVEQEEPETVPGDVIEFSVTEEVKTAGASRWVKVGLTSQHRPNETSAEAVDRIESFVTSSVRAYVETL